MYRARVFTFVLRVVKQYEEAEDIAQETFLRAWRYLARYNESRPFRSWLFAIARNLALNALRRPRAVIVSLDGEGGGRLVATIASSADSPAAEALSREQRRRLAAALQQLTPRAAMVFTLFYQEGMSIAEIARVAGMTRGAVKVALHRARETLRRHLAQPDEPPRGDADRTVADKRGDGE